MLVSVAAPAAVLVRLYPATRHKETVGVSQVTRNHALCTGIQERRA